jgi:hypothetical protein
MNIFTAPAPRPTIPPASFQYDSTLSGDVIITREIGGVERSATTKFNHLAEIVQTVTEEPIKDFSKKEMYFSNDGEKTSIPVAVTEIVAFISEMLRVQAIWYVESQLKFLKSSTDDEILSRSSSQSLLAKLAH